MQRQRGRTARGLQESFERGHDGELTPGNESTETDSTPKRATSRVTRSAGRSGRSVPRRASSPAPGRAESSAPRPRKRSAKSIATASARASAVARAFEKLPAIHVGLGAPLPSRRPRSRRALRQRSSPFPGAHVAPQIRGRAEPSRRATRRSWMPSGPWYGSCDAGRFERLVRRSPGRRPRGLTMGPSPGTCHFDFRGPATGVAPRNRRGVPDAATVVRAASSRRSEPASVPRHRVAWSDTRPAQKTPNARGQSLHGDPERKARARAGKCWRRRRRRASEATFASRLRPSAAGRGPAILRSRRPGSPPRNRRRERLREIGRAPASRLRMRAQRTWRSPERPDRPAAPGRR